MLFTCDGDGGDFGGPFSLKLPHGIHNGQVTVCGQCSQCENGHADRHVFNELGELAHNESVGPGLHCIYCGREWHAK